MILLDNIENELDLIINDFNIQNSLIQVRIFNNETIINLYRNLEYKEYLKTIYWKIIRHIKLEEAEYKCQECKDETDLDIHHLSYEHLGYEYLFLSDLIALCRKCHNKKHEKEVISI